MSVTVVAGLTDNPILNGLLARHPNVTVAGHSQAGLLNFSVGDWHRIIQLNVPGADIAEIADNNPMVCADGWACPDATTTLARIALDPLFRADVVMADPVVVTSFPPVLLPETAFARGIELAFDEAPMGTVKAASAMVEVAPLENLNEFDALFAEAYERSFCVRLAEADLNQDFVANQAVAFYDLRITPGEDTHLLTVQVLADEDGKLGAAQVVHLLNIMCGLEETLGIEGSLVG